MIRLLQVPVLLLFLASPLLAQQTTGEIRGQLIDAAGRPLAGFTVRAEGTHLLGARTVRAATDGVFQLLALPPGSYTVNVRGIGYTPVAVSAVAVQIGRASNLGTLTLALSSTNLEAVQIIAPRISLDPIHTTIGATLDANELADLPTDRDYTSIIAILPHANQSLRGDPTNVGGATGLENMYFIDGVNVTAPVRAASGNRLPYNFVRALEVKTGGYEAQYGRALGAIVNAITYSGTNDFEVSVFGFTTTDGLSAVSRAEPTLRSLSTLNYDVGVRVGGPVVRDRLWYSAAYNPRSDVADRAVNGVGTSQDRRTTQVFAGKLTWQASPSAHVELSLFGDPTVHEAVENPGWEPAHYLPTSFDPFLVERRSGGTVAAINTTFTRGQSLVEVVASSASAVNVSRSRGPLGDVPSYTDYLTETLEGGWPEFGDGKVGRTSFAVRATHHAASHLLRAGVEFEETFSDGTGGQINTSRTSVDSWNTFTFVSKGRYLNRTPTIFIQDGWRVSERLTLNIGVRLSEQTLVGARGKVAQRFRGEWQPRVGFVWRPEASERSRFFGSAGRFYQQAALFLSGGFFSDATEQTQYFSSDPRQVGVVPDSTRGGSYLWDPASTRVKNPSVEHTDELTLGYERLLGNSTRMTARIMRRDLRSSFNWAYDPPNWLVGTPGKGNLDFLPSPTRTYHAFELSAERVEGSKTWRASYVLSRTRGNYSGLFDADLGIATPGGNRSLITPFSAPNSTGLLPNDRTHVLKVSGSRELFRGLQAGAIASWMSGTPISELAPCPCNIGVFRVFTSPRGTSGRTPSLWNLDVRLAYRVPQRGRLDTNVLLDVLNVGNPQRTAWTNELRYLTNTNGVLSNVNPNYGSPIAFQRPAMARLGMEVKF